MQLAEKTYISFRLEVRNKGGHSSLPVKDNAIYHLSEALARLAKFDFPVILMDVTRAYFERMANLDPSRAADMKRLISTTPPDPAAVARLADSAYFNALPPYHLCCHPAGSRARRQCPAATGPCHRKLPDSARPIHRPGAKNGGAGARGRSDSGD